ncbi:hypothetical protein [Campylobacter geochelonis]|uniref:hypothetical protein n=1 Tax=Campylobacter geochelonis TaxID=1780362 RepID=UPI00077086A3|nr:hypothetical protein [Campylobacter geochelonis]CZE47304.1 Diaminopimelate epimerase [Campylobacter geochelonis]
MEYKVFIPSGNPTALVVDGVYDEQRRKEINNEIMQKHSFIEQVGFLDDKFNLIMAGGEQCVNAIRCAAYYHMKRLNLNEIKIKNCGEIFSCEKNRRVVSVKSKVEPDIIRLSDSLYKVRLTGIVHLVCTLNLNFKNEDEFKKYAMGEFEKYGVKNEKACGFMLLNGLELKPVVYVRDIDTLFYETACGSGTIACAMIRAYIKKDDVSLRVKQPSGKVLEATIGTLAGQIYKFKISGEIEEYAW